MKFSKYFMLAGAAALLTACSSEEPIAGPGADQEPVDANVFFKVAFNSTATRATETEAGLDAEQTITSAQFLFFDSTEGTAECKEAVTVTAEGWYSDTHNSKCAVVGLKNRHDYVVAVVNAEITNPELRTINELLKRTVSEYKPTAGFVMTSESKFVAEDKPNNILTPIATTAWYTTADLAQKAETPITINVERVVAKVTFEAESSYTITEDQYETGITFEFTPEKMFLTRVAQDKGFSFKKLIDFNSFKIDFATEEMTEFKTLASASNAVAATPQYAFETPATNDIKVIVAGKYVAKDGDGNEISKTGDGTFWIVNNGKKYHVVGSLEEVQELLGTDDESVYIKVNNTKTGKWTGWWAVAGSPWTVMKFNTGKGYYFKDFAGNSDDRKLVRNKWYKINVESIAQLGWGLKDGDNGDIDPFIDPEEGGNELYLHLNVECNPWEVINNTVKW